MRSVRTLAQRYWEKVDVRGPDECWPWTAATNAAGYGILGVWDGSRGRSVLAHRIGWGLVRGEAPGELCVLHSCDTPACQNPRHHFLGTRLDNNADRHAKARDARGSAAAPARLSEAAAREIHRRYSDGEQLIPLADEFGVHHSTISAIARGRSWRHLGLPVVPPRPPGGERLAR